MNDSVIERLAILETQQEQCAVEREALKKDVDHIMSTIDQIRGGIRMLVVLWTIAVAVVGLVGVKYVTAAPAPAAMHP